jgi:hypothetical protein
MTDDDLFDGLPAPESEPLREDLPVVRRWAAATGDTPQIRVDRRRYDAGQGHVLLVVTVAADADAVSRHLVPLLRHPDRLRVRVARPSDAELRRVLDWVLNEHMVDTRDSYVSSAGIDDRAGVVQVANRRDPELAARLAAHESGLIRVSDVPVRAEKA